MSGGAERLYTDLAAWWPLMSAPDDYDEEAAYIRQTLDRAASGPVREVLELGSGGGNNAAHLKAWYDLTLTDLSAGMLAHSEALNPGCVHHVGDMRTLRLGRTFDAVLVHDAVAYMTTREDLRAAADTAFVHCRPGGVAFFLPDVVKETWENSTEHGGHDAPDGRGLRYLEWSHDPDPADDTTVTDYVYLLREADGSVTTVPDRHVEGLFDEATWLAALRGAGFDVEVVADDPYGRRGFVGRR